MDASLSSKFYSIESQTKLLVNNEFLSDVTFIVGDEKTKILAHKHLLALGSPVFHKMLFGDLKMDTDKPIQITDITSTGFLNMIKYIYGYKISDFKLSEFHETFKAADKYIVFSFCDHMMMYMEDNLNESNCCLMYDQLIKMQKNGEFMNQVKQSIERNSKSVFSSDYLKEISRETLIDLLKMKFLDDINEIDLLKACLNWIDAETIRLGIESNTKTNQLQAFKSIKALINFGRLNADEIVSIKNLDKLLTEAEIGQLFLHLFEKTKPLMFGSKITREKLKVNSFRTIMSENLCESLDGFHTEFSVNHEISILAIHTRLSDQISNLVFTVDEDGFELDLRFKKESINGYFYFKFNNVFDLYPKRNYCFKFTFDAFVFDSKNLLTTATVMKSTDDQNIEINFKNSTCSCICAIDFCKI